MLRRLYAVTIISAGFALIAPAAQAQDATSWQQESHAAVRLIAGAALNLGSAARQRAGIEIRLDRGWKTYWRDPGDSGVPPKIDFTGSTNVKAVDVLWPAPQRFDDGAGGYSIGYRGDVILPLRVVPQDQSKPSALHVQLGYAICGTLCVPGEAKLDLVLTGHGGNEEPLLEAAEARVPKREPLGAAAPGTSLAVRSVHRETEGKHESVIVEVAAPASEHVDLFVEGPTPDWALPQPQPSGPDAGASSGLRRFSFDVDGVPPQARIEGAMLTFTAVSAHDAIEVQTHLD